MKLYLDTNIFLGWFKKNILNIRRSKPIEDTITMMRLNSTDMKLYTSNLSLIEVINYLKGGFFASKKEIELLWNVLTDLYNIRIIPAEIRWEKIKNIMIELPMKRSSIMDIIHLETAKRNNCKFVTFDKELRKLSWMYDISFL